MLLLAYIPEEGVAPSLHLSVAAIEKGAFWLLSTVVTNYYTSVY